MKSMTGYGHAEKRDKQYLCSVDISSINRKNFDLKISSQEYIPHLELPLQNLISKKISRGTVILRLSLTSINNTSLNNHNIENKFKDIHKFLKTISKKLKILNTPTLIDIIKVYDIINKENLNHQYPDRLILTTVSAALNKLDLMRKKEGLFLQKDISKRIAKLFKILMQIENKTKDFPKNRKKILIERVKSMGIELDSNDDRIIKEIAILAEKCDCSEEITRLKSHLQQLTENLDSSEPIGKKLDFIVQEIFREISTLSIKVTPCSISPLTIEFKTELEKIREQIQNIE
ncbi:MAG TPA: YicC family protein [Victivallales bacterium]|nr:YicC family protein [Victivallales bacterium]HPO90572.1 YicC family protein [Victivallales bacterium]HRR06055.1 YicC family protein [Victivallales bacterium]HRU00396.1 YicC family protein [Victivallales bacterium]